MKRIILAFLFLLSTIVVPSLIHQNNANACQRGGPVVLSYTCKISDYIIRARAVKYLKKPKDPNSFTTGVPDSKVKFEVLEILKGDSINSFALHGYLNSKDDFNDMPVPYTFVRPGGRSGSCYANTYKKGAEYLLFMKKTGVGFTVNIDPLAPVNEQLHSSEDSWVYYIKGLLKGIEETNNLKKK